MVQFTSRRYRAGSVFRKAIASYLILLAVQGPGLCSCTLRGAIATVVHSSHGHTHDHESAGGWLAQGSRSGRKACCQKWPSIPASHHQLPCGEPDSPGDDCPCNHHQFQTALTGNSGSLLCDHSSLTWQPFAAWHGSPVNLTLSDGLASEAGQPSEIRCRSRGREILRACCALRC